MENSLRSVRMCEIMFVVVCLCAIPERLRLDGPRNFLFYVFASLIIE